MDVDILGKIVDLVNTLTYRQRAIFSITIAMVTTMLLYGVISSRRRRKSKIQEQVRRVKMANEPGYLRHDRGSSMRTYLEDGVIKYSRHGPIPEKQIQDHKDKKKREDMR